MTGKGMRRPAKVLTARFVETVSVAGKYFDGHGLFLRVNDNGSRQWVQRITIRGKRREIGLGSPPAVTLAAARKLALENKGKAVQGGDPIQDRRAARAGLTFADAVDHYLASKLDGMRSEKGRKQWRSSLYSIAIPVLGPMRVTDITVQDVLRALEPVWTRTPETGSRVRGRIEAVLSWATVAGHRSGDNPARWKGNLSELLPRPEKVAKSGNQPALALTDAPRWWAALARRDGNAARALQFVALTGCRSGEARGMTWDELDLGDQAAGWTVPGERMKAGRSHRVPLTAEAVALLQAMPRLDGCPFVFFAPRGGTLSDMALSAVMKRLQAAEEAQGLAGYCDPVSGRPAVPHGLRSTFRQWAAERGFDRDMAELQLAHNVGDKVERAYQRSDMLERRRAMMAEWAAFLRGEAAGGNVVRLDVAGR